MVSMFFCFISVMLELAVSSVNLAKAWTYASRSNYTEKPVTTQFPPSHSLAEAPIASEILVKLFKSLGFKCPQTCMLKMQAILTAHRMPSRHSEATSGSSQSWSPTLNAASRGVHASWNTNPTGPHLLPSFVMEHVQSSGGEGKWTPGPINSEERSGTADPGSGFRIQTSGWSLCCSCWQRGFTYFSQQNVDVYRVCLFLWLQGTSEKHLM